MVKLDNMKDLGWFRRHVEEIRLELVLGRLDLFWNEGDVEQSRKALAQFADELRDIASDIAEMLAR